MEEPKYAEKINQNEVICKNCAAKLSFKPGTTSLTCEYCGADNPIEVKSEPIEEIDFLSFIENKAQEAPTMQVSTVKCEACGAQTTFNPSIVSDSCAFCGNNIVIKGGTTQNIIKPKSLLPFAIEQKQGVELFKKWLGGLWFAPSNLKKYARQDGRLTGIYVPYWTYDSDTRTYYTGEQGIDRTETYEENGQTRTRTVTDWYSVSGNVSRAFDDVMVVASNSLPMKHVDGLEPWDLNNLISFDERFLSGFKAESYQVDVKSGFEVAKGKMEVVIRQDVRADIGGDKQRIDSIDTSYNDITFKHILLPIWISAYKYNNKVYRFLVNGRTGEVKGERPWSWIKITLAIILVLAIIGGIVYLANK